MPPNGQNTSEEIWGTNIQEYVFKMVLEFISLPPQQTHKHSTVCVDRVWKHAQIFEETCNQMKYCATLPHMYVFHLFKYRFGARTR